MQVADLYQLLTPLGFLVLAAFFFFLGRNRVEVRSSYWFAAAYALAAFGFTITFFRDLLPYGVLLTLGTLFKLGATLSAATGLIKLSNKKVPVTLFTISAVSIVTATLFFHYIIPDQKLANITNSGVTAIIFLTASMMAWRPDAHIADKVVVILYSLFGVSFLVSAGLFMSVADTATVLASPKLLEIFNYHSFFSGILALLCAFAAVFAYTSQLIRLMHLEANTDPLTGLLNRRAFQEKIKVLSNRAMSRQHGVFLILADLDKFKTINDTYGHGTGDKILTTVARTLQQQCGENAFAARIGGEEFVVALMTNTAGEAKIFANDLRAAVQGLVFETELDPIIVTISLGIAEQRQDETLLQTGSRADAALYLAKDKGRNCVMTEEDLVISKLKQQTLTPEPLKKHYQDIA